MRRSYLDTRLGQVHCASTGSPAAQPVVLLPQAGRSWTMHSALMAELSDTYRVHAIDFPGSGGSDVLPSSATIEDIAGAVVDVMDGLSIDRAFLYGLHAGNKVGAALAAAYPVRVRKFVFAGQSHSIVASNEKRLGTTAKMRLKLLAPADERETALVQWADLFSFISSHWWQEALMRGIADPVSRATVVRKVVDELQASGCIADFYRANRAYDLERDLANITVPTLVLEIATPHETQRVGLQGPSLQQIIAGSELVTLEEADFHGITLEDKPEVLAAILRKFFATP
ncbi:MAG: alpha/beta fold hydrolase [Hyphomicrobiaceae bacterium]